VPLHEQTAVSGVAHTVPGLPGSGLFTLPSYEAQLQYCTVWPGTGRCLAPVTKDRRSLYAPQDQSSGLVRLTSPAHGTLFLEKDAKDAEVSPRQFEY
jgi:hypothetical protein